CPSRQRGRGTIPVCCSSPSRWLLRCPVVWSCRLPHRVAHSFPPRRSSDLLFADAVRDAFDPRLHLTLGSVEHGMQIADPQYAVEIGRAQSELQSRFDLVCRLLLEKKNRLALTMTARGSRLMPATRRPTPAR